VKKWIAVTAVFSVFVLVISFTACKTSEQKKAYQVLGDIRKKIEAEMNKLDGDLKLAAQNLSGIDMSGEESRSILRALVKDRPYVTDSCTIDRYGRIIALEPEKYREFEGSDISGQEQVIRLFRTQKPVLSSNFKSVEGFEAADFEYPVISADKKISGSVSVMLKPEILLGSIVAGTSMDKMLSIMVMQPDGRIIYEADSSQIGRNTFTDPLYEPFPALLDLARKISVKSSGSGGYFFLDTKSNKNINKEALWDTFSFNGTEWRIVLIMAAS